MAGKPKPKKQANEELLKKQPKLWRDALTADQKAVFMRYAKTTKLRAVLRWPQRRAAARISAVDVADAVGQSRSRISEYENFYAEPKEETFLKIESALYKLGA